MGMLDDITFCISAFERPKLCQNTIDRINRLYSGARIVVADDSKEFISYSGVLHIWKAPYDTGLAGKRNHLADHAQTPYVMMLDDDMLIEPGSIEALYSALESDHNWGVAGMAKRDALRKRWANSEARIDIRKNGKGKHLVMRRPKKRAHGLYDCGFVPNCFLARTDIMRRVRYNEKYKICGEHLDFFMRLKPVVGCVFVAGPYFVDVGTRPEGYKAPRKRGKRFRRQMLRDWGITKVKKWAKPGKRVVYE